MPMAPYHYVHKVQYHETDKMGITHHSNYIKWMEEARVAFLDSIGLPYRAMEDRAIFSPVVSVAVEYKTPSTFEDEIDIQVSVLKYTGVQLEVSYHMSNTRSGETVATASSRHCFLKDGKICSLKRAEQGMHEVLSRALCEEMDTD